MSGGSGMYYLRVFLIGLGFSLFGLVGILGNFVFLPIVYLRFNRYATVRFFTRDLVRWSWFLYLQSLRICGVISYSFDYKYRHQNKLLIICNHPSLLDVVFLLAYIPRANCIVKADLKKNIFLRFAIEASGYIANANPEDFLEKSIESLNQSETLIIFPEGTRTKSEINFHKATSYLAINGAEKIEMLYIQSYQNALKKGQKWYNVSSEKLRYRIYSLGEKNLLNFDTQKPNPLRVRQLHKCLNEIYQTQQKEQNGTTSYE